MFQLIFNKNSLPFNTKNDCENNLLDTFRLLVYASKKHINFMTVCENSILWRHLVFQEHFVFELWLNNLPKENGRLVKSFMDRNKLLYTNMADKQVDFELKNVVVPDPIDIGYAAIHNKCTFSIPTNDYSKKNTFNLTVMEEINSEVKLEEKVVTNIFSKNKIDKFYTVSLNQMKKNKEFLNSLKTDNNIYYPNLMFSDAALKNLKQYSPQYDINKRIIDCLDKLHSSLQATTNKPDFLKSCPLTISPESPTTMQTPRLAKQRYFDHPTKGKDNYWDHVKNIHGGKRMYIDIDFDVNKVCILDVGEHFDN